MSGTLEKKINSLLIQYDEPLIVADELLKYAEKTPLSPYELNSLCLFLIRAGFYPTAISLVKKLLSQNFKIPWAGLLELLSIFQEKLSKDVISQILIGATDEEALDQIVFCKGLDQIDPRFSNLREKFLIKESQEVQKKKNDLINRANIYRNDGLHEEEQEILKEIKKIDPSDKIVEKRSEDAALTRIKELLLKKENELLGRQLDFKEEIIDPIIPQAFVTAAKDNPDSAYLLSVALYQMECYQYALDALEYAPESIEKDWFKLDVLIQNKMYLELLSQVGQIEIKYAMDPETIFSAMIFKAKALWGLGEKSKAIQILEVLLRTRPTHTLAQTLLREWKFSQP